MPSVHPSTSGGRSVHHLPTRPSSRRLIHQYGAGTNPVTPILLLGGEVRRIPRNMPRGRYIAMPRGTGSAVSPLKATLFLRVSVPSASRWPVAVSHQLSGMLKYILAHMPAFFKEQALCLAKSQQAMHLLYKSASLRLQVVQCLPWPTDPMCASSRFRTFAGARLRDGGQDLCLLHEALCLDCNHSFSSWRTNRWVTCCTALSEPSLHKQESRCLLLRCLTLPAIS